MKKISVVLTYLPDMSKPLHLNPFAIHPALVRYLVTLHIPDRYSIISNNVVKQNHTAVPINEKNYKFSCHLTVEIPVSK